MQIVKFLFALVGALVVLLMGFAAITQPNHGGKSKTYYATMKADLRNLVIAQESYFADSLRYAPSLDVLGPSRYATSSGVTVVVTSATDSVWTATARHTGLAEDELCTMRVGLRDGVSVENDGEPQCPTQVGANRSWIFIWER